MTVYLPSGKMIVVLISFSFTELHDFSLLMMVLVYLI